MPFDEIRPRWAELHASLDGFSADDLEDADPPDPYLDDWARLGEAVRAVGLAISEPWKPRLERVAAFLDGLLDRRR